MFACFFPRPRLFLLTALIWIGLAVTLWHVDTERWPALIGLPSAPAAQTESISVGVLWSRAYLWFYACYWAAAGLFWLAWQLYAPHRWAAWSILGPAFIGFATHINADLLVLMNRWAGTFNNMVQSSLEQKSHATLTDFYGQFGVMVEIAMTAMAFVILLNFFASHFIFRWRTALNDHYTAHWMMFRHIEGASQRIQEDSMRFASLTETIGISIVAYAMILIAFLPLLAGLSAKIASVPLFGSLRFGLPLAAIGWGLSATAVLVLAGYKLPGLQMRNQRVEAAYRKELVYGEDDTARARPPALAALFSHVRENYFALYLKQLFFNIPRFAFIYLDSTVALFLLIPTILAGTITFGLFIQIIGAFENVRKAFEYLASIWPQVVELLSVYGRLRAFECAIKEAAAPEHITATEILAIS